MEISGANGFQNFQKRAQADKVEKASADRKDSIKVSPEGAERVSEVRRAGRSQKVAASSQNSELNQAPKRAAARGGLSSGLNRAISQQLIQNGNAGPSSSATAPKPTQAPDLNKAPKPEASQSQAADVAQKQATAKEVNAPKAQDTNISRDGASKKDQVSF